MKNTIKTILIMEEKDKKMHCALRLGFDIAKLVLKAGMIATAICLVKEVHKVHKAIEHKK